MTGPETLREFIPDLQSYEPYNCVTEQTDVSRDIEAKPDRVSSGSHGAVYRYYAVSYGGENMHVCLASTGSLVVDPFYEDSYVSLVAGVEHFGHVVVSGCVEVGTGNIIHRVDQNVSNVDSSVFIERDQNDKANGYHVLYVISEAV